MFIFLSVILYCIQFYGIILLKAIYGKCISTHTYGYLYSYNKFNTLFFYFLFYFILFANLKRSNKRTNKYESSIE